MRGFFVCGLERILADSPTLEASAISAREKREDESYGLPIEMKRTRRSHFQHSRANDRFAILRECRWSADVGSIREESARWENRRHHRWRERDQSLHREAIR